LSTTPARAEAKVLAYLASQGGYDAIIARLEAGRARPEDRATAANFIRRILGGQDRDGSWNDRLVSTARALLAVRELGAAAGIREVDPGVGRGLAWLKERQGGPGRFGEGCDPARHRIGLCHHFLGGFFGLGPGAAEPMALDHDGRIEDERSVRFAASALALRAFLAWDADSTDLRLHLHGLRHVAELDEAAGIVPEAALMGLHTLIRAPSPSPAMRAAAVAAVDRLGRAQRGDGSWSRVDVFHAVRVLLAAVERGVAAEKAGTPLGHAARLLAATQQDDGGWGGESPARRALIGWRALRAARELERMEPQP